MRTSVDQDWISSQNGPITILDKNNIRREGDSKIFVLREGVRETLEELLAQGYDLGVISDNKEDIALETLKAFDILRYFDDKLINITLRKGYCPKDQMIDEVYRQLDYTEIPEAWLVDDKNYKDAMKNKGYNFILANGKSLLDNCKVLLM